MRSNSPPVWPWCPRSTSSRPEAVADAELLAVPRAKVTDYLLNPHHLEGWSKAKFFLARGFDRDRPEVLANALAGQAELGWPGHVQPVPSGVKHRVHGPIDCPDGSRPDILTVWHISEGERTAFLVTARPGRFRSA